MRFTDTIPIAFFVLALAPGCRSPERATRTSAEHDAAEQDQAEPEIAAMLAELYRAFCFDAHAEPDWAAMRALFADGAVFVGPARAGTTPVGVDAERFLADFAAYAASSPFDASGFHERIVHARIDAYGGIGHAYVAFEGFVPGEPGVLTRGLDSVQLVRDGTRWLLVSFTTQYESPATPMPARFLAGPARFLAGPARFLAGPNQ